MSPELIRRAALVLGTLLLLCTLAPAAANAAANPACPHATTPAAGAATATIRRAVLCLIDQQRLSRGLPALAANARLDSSAQEWSQSMVSNGEFSHGSDFAARITQAGFAWSEAGENIATGFDTPAQVVQAWMASTGHCQNILAPYYSEIGVGFIARPVAGDASSAATWTTDFGLPSGVQPPSRDLDPMRGCPYGG
jgi:uncharacterized protein YkwD